MFRGRRERAESPGDLLKRASLALAIALASFSSALAATIRLPQADGTIRVIEITGLDRQACGGTHLSSTGQSPPVRILKVDNKGRHNRRIRIGLAG